MTRCQHKYLLFLSVLLLLTGLNIFAQAPGTPSPAQPASPATKQPGNPSLPPTAPAASPQRDSLPPMPVLGPNDTIPVPAHNYNGEMIAARSLELTWVRAPMTPAMRRKMEEWTRLRNAVYVTYPYARRAGLIMNEMNAKLALLSSESERKTYIQSKEKILKKEFTTPLENLSIYQGKILMKLINRQTGNNCYNIIKEYKGGFTARFWQTLAFFFGSNLKQPYDPQGDDQQIELIVQEVERMYRG